MNAETDMEDGSLTAWVGRAAVAIAAIGVMVGYRRFTKMETGPIHILEILFLIWVACVLVTHSRHILMTFFHLSYPTLLFTAWGVFLISCDLISYRANFSAFPVSRVAQHALTILYPVMWSMVGYWCLMTCPSFAHVLAIVLLLCNILPNFYGQNVTNIAVGPLMPIIFMLVLNRLRWVWHDRLSCIGQGLLIVGLACFTYLPFWQMWTTKMQRTTLLMLFTTLIIVPGLLKVQSDSSWRWLRTTFVAFGIFILGLVAYAAGAKRLTLTPAPPVLSNKTMTPTIRVATASRLLKSPPAPAPAPKPTQTPPPTAAIKATTPPAAELSRTTKQAEQHTFQNVFASFYHPEDLNSSSRIRFPMMRTRRHMWYSAFADWRSHPFVGVGFVPEVPSEVAPGWKNSGGFETPFAPPVTGPHNSYLSILTRTGLVGLLLFLWMVCRFVRQARTIYRCSPTIGLFELLIFLVPLNGAIHAFLNVGFESPPRAMLMWLFVGMLTSQYAQIRTERCDS